MTLRERDVLERIRKAFPGSGIGDDTAVLPRVEGELLLASDASVEGVHFVREFSTIDQAVQKTVTANVSDVYAMGGVPRAIVVTAGIPAGAPDGEVEGIIRGLEVAGDIYNVKVAGGDTVRSPGGYFFDVAILGSVAAGRAVKRSGAREGDLIVLFGACGASLLGLTLLKRLFGGEERAPVPTGIDAAQLAALARSRELVSSLSTGTTVDDIGRMCRDRGLDGSLLPMIWAIKKYLVPRAVQVAEKVLASARPALSAMIDISDGLSRDLSSLCGESGVGACVDETALPVPGPLGPLFENGGGTFTDLALSSGEEYVMLAAVRGTDPGRAPEGGRVIGRIIASGKGLVLAAGDGTEKPLPVEGYEHLF